MKGKLLASIKWGAGTWPAGTVVSIIAQSEHVADKVKIERFAGGPTAWVYLDDMEPLD
ncbi:hypothetical protein [Sporomusa aerivorans]|uniref:hypothetical protein n=1 Tax=Sporomusa aerivorans TaxID=204936 RepID=UPI00352A7808